MTEIKRLKEGKLFDPRSEELVSLKAPSHRLCHEYNALEETDPGRAGILKKLLGSVGERALMLGPIRFNYGSNTFIGDDFFANWNFTVLDDATVTIGDHVMIGPNVSIICAEHPLLYTERESLLYPDGHTGRSEYSRPITIGDHVWIGSGATILSGVNVGMGAVIAAGSLVTKDVPPMSLVMGVPARVVRRINEKDSRMDLL